MTGADSAMGTGNGVPGSAGATPSDNGACRFPSTRWSQVLAAGEAPTQERVDILNELIKRYWKPIYVFLRHRGYRDDEAKELTQAFFCQWLEKELVAWADPARGRFRSFLLKSVTNFVANVHRAEGARRRRPEGGLVSIDELTEDGLEHYQPIETETPDRAFHRAWVCELITRVLAAMERDFTATDKAVHFHLFRQWIVGPILEGVEPPSLETLADPVGLTVKEASNRILTARRAFQRLLREEIRRFAASEEEVAAEVDDLGRFVAGH